LVKTSTVVTKRGNTMTNETERINIYGNARNNMTNEKEKLKKSELSEKNKQLVSKYINFKQCNSISANRCNKLSCILRLICRLVEKDLDTVSKDDIMDLIIKIKNMPNRSEATIQDYILVLKQFYKWFEDEDERVYSYDEKERRKILALYKYIKNTQMKNYCKKINPSDILTEEDIKEVLICCRTYREKAFIRMLHEMGARAGEFLNIKIKHIIFETDEKAKIHLDGKTGERRVPIVYSIPYLKQYLESHPHKNNPNAFLWWTEQSANTNKPLKHGGSCKMLTELWKRIPNDKIVKRKKHNMHFFRHSRASLLAPNLTESMLCKYMGWTIGSKQVKTYVHLSPDDLDKVYYSNLGIITDEKVKETIKAKICPVCGILNDSIADYCIRCAKPLSVDATIRSEMNAKRQTIMTVEKMQELMKNPEFVAFMDKMNLKT
jgi:integrase